MKATASCPEPLIQCEVVIVEAVAAHGAATYGSSIDTSQLSLALAGDTMLGRKVAGAIWRGEAASLVDARVVDSVREADLFVLNLECRIAGHGERWHDPAKPFCFRAPAVATEVLIQLGVDCVTLANNHALAYGPEAVGCINSIPPANPRTFQAVELSFDTPHASNAPVAGTTAPEMRMRE
jgi:hypothetical protein